MPGSWFDAAPAGDASDTVAGIIELATTAEVTTGTDATKAVTPAGLRARTYPICQVTNDATQSVSTGTNTSIIYNVEDSDTLGWHASNSASIIPTYGPGWYRATHLSIFSSAMVNGTRAIRYLYMNDVVVGKSDYGAGTGTVPANLSGIAYLDGDDESVYVAAYHGNGSSIDLYAGSTLTVEFLGR